jgi:transposase
MIGIPPGVRILIAMQPVDFRRGADSLAALAKEVLQQDPFSGTVLVFRSKRGRPREDRRLGRDRPGHVVEAA